MKKRATLDRRNDDSTILQHFRPSDTETAIRAPGVGGPVALLMDDDVPGVSGEVTGSDKLPTDAEANAGLEKTSAGESESRFWLHRSSSG